MRIFDLPVEDVRRLVESVRAEAAPESFPEVFARMTWSVLIEPGDQVAGQLLAALGPGPALDLLISQDPTPAIDVWLEDGAPASRAERVVTEAFARWRPRLVARSVTRAIEQAAALRMQVAVPEGPGWPSGLSDLGPAEPVVLWVRGDPGALDALGDSLAVVGARAATGYGEYVAAEIAGGVAERGRAIVSGGAYGIDAAAHRATLAADAVTIAFLAGGLDRYYPAGNSDLLHRASRTGAVISEVPPGAAPTKVRFLMRNRLLAAATAATIVVEAGLRSGSLNTAHHALAIGRPVGAVPGPVTSPASAGCHRLLREDNAICITSADDAIELVGGERAVALGGYEPADPAVVRVLDSIGVRRGRTVDEIARSSGMAVGETLSVLGPLELAGVVRRADSGWVRVPGVSTPSVVASSKGPALA